MRRIHCTAVNYAQLLLETGPRPMRPQLLRHPVASHPNADSVAIKHSFFTNRRHRMKDG